MARLHQETMAKASEAFEGDLKLKFHLAPPLLPGRDASGRPKKRAFGAWMTRVWGPLASMKSLRGTPFDPFGYSAERRAERRLIRQYERDMSEVLPKVTPETTDAIRALAELPLDIRGFGPVKAAAMEKAADERESLLTHIRAGGAPSSQAAE